MTLLVRNEQDIIEENIRFHASQGVDHFIVMDNLSTDATTEILRSISQEFEIDLLFQSDDDFRQAEWVTDMARRAARDHGSDWVINSDADEFWLPTTGRVRDYLASLPPNISALRINRHNATVIQNGSDPHSGRSHPLETVTFESQSYNNVGRPLPGKVIHRGSEQVSLDQGNHTVRGIPNALTAPCDQISIMHFPHRTLSQYKTKIRVGGAAYARNTTLPPDIGRTWRTHFKELDTGGVDAFWNEISETSDSVTEGLATGRLFRNTTLKHHLAGLKMDQR